MNRKLKSAIVAQYGSQSDFAAAIGEHEAIVSRVVRGRTRLNPEKQAVWSKCLGVPARELFTEMEVRTRG